MIKFFRRIRQRLLSQNRFKKYLVYAIGEIILVVIGILIALQINNANENSKNEEVIRMILKQVHSELAENIHEVNRLNRYFQRKDSVIRLMMNDKIDLANFKGNYDASIRSNAVFIVKDQGFKNLLSNSNKIPHELDSLISKLKNLFILQKEEVEFNNKAIDNNVIEYEKWLKFNTSWYKERYFDANRKPSKEELEFYTSKTSLFKNFVLDYYLAGPNGLNFASNQFRYHSYSLYKELSEFLEIPEEEISSFSTPLTDEEKNEIIGSYKFNNRIVDFILKDGKLHSKSKQNGIQEIIMLTKTTFSLHNQYISNYFSFVKETGKGVTGIKISFNNDVNIMKKIK